MLHVTCGRARGRAAAVRPSEEVRQLTWENKGCVIEKRKLCYEKKLCDKKRMFSLSITLPFFITQPFSITNPFLLICMVRSSGCAALARMQRDSLHHCHFSSLFSLPPLTLMHMAVQGKPDHPAFKKTAGRTFKASWDTCICHRALSEQVQNKWNDVHGVQFGSALLHRSRIFGDDLQGLFATSEETAVETAADSKVPSLKAIAVGRLKTRWPLCCTPEAPSLTLPWLEQTSWSWPEHTSCMPPSPTLYGALAECTAGRSLSGVMVRGTPSRVKSPQPTALFLSFSNSLRVHCGEGLQPDVATRLSITFAPMLEFPSRKFCSIIDP